MKRTKTISSLDPIFNDEQSIQVDLLEREQKATQLRVVVKDQDTLQDEVVGEVRIGLAGLLEGSTTWLNGYYQLSGQTGYVYLLVEFVLKGHNRQTPQPKIQEFNEYLQLGHKSLEGEIFINIVGAEGLLDLDMLGGKSDSYVRVTLDQ